MSNKLQKKIPLFLQNYIEKNVFISILKNRNGSFIIKTVYVVLN